MTSTIYEPFRSYLGLVMIQFKLIFLYLKEKFQATSSMKEISVLKLTQLVCFL